MGLKKQVPNKIILHVADTPDEKDFDVSDVNEWHKQRGFTPASNGNYCGYHYLVRRSGVIEQARPEDEVGVHTAGHNTGALGICWIGRHEMTEMQRDSLIALVLMLLQRWNLKVTDIYAHHNFNELKTCPNFDSPKTFTSLVAFRETIAKILDESEKSENGGKNETVS